MKEFNFETEKLLSICKKCYSTPDLESISLALNLINEKCSQLKRSSGEVYNLHPIRVASIVVQEIKMNSVGVVVALIHDAYQDGHIDEKQVRDTFGNEITNILVGLIKISTLYTQKLSLQSNNFIALLLNITNDVRIILLKLADRLDNIRNIKNLSEEKQLQIAKEIRLLYAPIAHRLGLYHIKTEFEDISLKIIEPENYFDIAGKLNETKRERENYIQEFSVPIIEELKKINCQFEIKGRPKSVNSIYGKLIKKDIDISEIYDLFAIRIIIDNVPKEKEKESCWNVYSIVTNIYSPNPLRLRDWISTPRPSGYESLHTTVSGVNDKWVEVQIRTRRMDDIAEKGDAAHWRYKEADTDKSHDLWLKEIRQALENKNPDDISQLKEKYSKRINDEIFIFTPKGDIKKFKNGATILDFAYSIHSKIGDTCTGAKVNEKIVPIKYKLKNGDTIEIITSKKQIPRAEWVNIANSTKAKSKIRQALNEQKFKYAEIGKEMLERKFSQLKMENTEQHFLSVIHHFKYKKASDFYEDIANEKFDLQKIKEFFLQKEKTENTSISTEEQSATEYKQKEFNTNDVLIIEKNLIDIDYTLAKCCRPIPGDDIFGFITINRGIQVHRKNCPNAKYMYSNFPYRIIQTRWTEHSKDNAFLTEILITGIDKIGIVNHISEVISKNHSVNMRSLNINTKDGMFQGSISLFINNLNALESLIENINKIKGVLKTERMDKRKNK